MPNVIAAALYALIGSIILIIVAQVYQVVMDAQGTESISAVAPSTLPILNLSFFALTAVMVLTVVFWVFGNPFFQQRFQGGGFQ